MLPGESPAAIPTYGSWPNQVERFFALITDKAIRRASFTSVKQLVQRIDHFVAAHKFNCQPFKWNCRLDSRKIASILRTFWQDSALGASSLKRQRSNTDDSWPSRLAVRGVPELPHPRCKTTLSGPAAAAQRAGPSACGFAQVIGEVAEVPMMNVLRLPRLDDIRLGVKLHSCFAAVLLLMLLLGSLAASQLRSSNQIIERIDAQWLPTVRITLDLRSMMNEFRTQEFELIVAADGDERKPHGARLAALSKQIDDAAARYSALPRQGAVSAGWPRLLGLWRDYVAEYAKIRKLADADQNDTARSVIRDKSQQIFATLMAELDRLVADGVSESDAATLVSRKDYSHALIVMGAAIVGALTLGFGLA